MTTMREASHRSRNGSLAQAILACGAFRVFEHLVQRTLTHVQHGLPREMLCSDFLQGRWLNSHHGHTSAIMAATRVSSGGATGQAGSGERVSRDGGAGGC